MKTRLAFVLSALLLAGCGGGGGGSTPTAPAKSTQSVAGSVAIFIPAANAATAGHVRYPQFVSPNASSVAINVNGGSDTFFDVSSASSLCTTVSGVGRTCMLSFSAPPGNDTFGFIVFQGVNGTGAQLASATKTQTIVAGQGFNFTVGLNAAIGTVVANITGDGAGNCFNRPANQPDPTIDEGCTGSATMTVVIQDPSQVVLPSTATLATPIAITPGDASLSASPSTITQAGQAITLNYNGSAFGSTVTNQVTFSLGVGTLSIPVTIPVTRANLYVANSNAPFGSPPAGGGNVAVYPFGSNASAVPTRVIQGTNTGLLTPAVPLVDSGGFLFVLDDGTASPSFNPSIKVFAPGATNTAPVRQIMNIGAIDGASTCQDMVFDPTKQFLFVACSSDVFVFSVSLNGSASGNVLATYTTSGFPNGIGFDPAGNFYIADSSENSLFIIAGPIATSGTGTLSSPISIDGFDNDAWPSTLTPFHLAFDNNGTLYMPLAFQSATMGAPDASAELGIWRTSNLVNNGHANATLTGAPFTTHAVVGAALDYFGNVYVVNSFSTAVSVFSAATISGAAGGTNATPIRSFTEPVTGPNAPVGMTVGP